MIVSRSLWREFVKPCPSTVCGYYRYRDLMVTPALINVLVIGAGVSGLTTAVCLAESDPAMRVRVLAKDPPAGTTSAHAGASWGPYLVDDSRVLDWSNDTLATLASIATEHPESGVRLVNGLEAAPFPLEPPVWARTVDEFRVCPVDELPAGYVNGWRYRIPIVDMPTYLAYLEGRLAAVGVSVEIAEVTAFAEAADPGEIVVNCTGLGARNLVPDTDISPTRGQLVVVENPNVDWFFQDHAEGEDLTYFLQHGDHVVLGGSAIPGSDNEVPDPAIAKAIIARCARIEPRFADAKVLEHRVGLRPSRSRVRVERGDTDATAVIHNYGHGGSGLTLSWGCAREVLAQVNTWATRPVPSAP
jgi:D-amino-acid oxidase